MTDELRRVTLTKAQSATPQGEELIALLADLSEDGMVSREEVSQLRAWLEVDRGVSFPALPFLYGEIEEISEDGEISEEELDRLALAIERVLPKDVRASAVERRKQAREASRVAERERRREAVIAQRADAQANREAANARAGILYRREFPVRGAFRSAERREACGRLIDGDTVLLEREPDNAHDRNAILVLGADNCELGYVPREDSGDMAPLLDSGAEASATIRRLWETPDGQIVPIVAVAVRRGDSNAAPVPPNTRRQSRSVSKTQCEVAAQGSGCGCALALCVVGVLAIFLLIVAV